MDRSKTRRIKKELQQLVDQKRNRKVMQEPCPDCGQLPIWTIAVDEETGLDFRTGQPPCERCRTLQEQRMPDRVNVIEFTPVDPTQDGYDQDPDGPGPSEPAAA